MIDIISLEKVLIDLIKVFDGNQLEKFKKKLSDILNIDDFKDKTFNKVNNNKLHICNHPRTQNRGYCKKKNVKVIIVVFI
jgi:hypothetical protein